MESIVSPLTGNKVEFVEDLSTKTIVGLYQTLGVNVASYFTNLSKISIYRCVDTGYRFYYPFNVMGNDLFYEDLQTLRSTYYPLRWEHKNAVKYIKDGDSVLDIGCGSGSFLAMLKQERKGITAKGLEFNQKAIRSALEKGLDIEAAFIEKYSEEHAAEYDVVSSFQVLEHIVNVQSFIGSAIKCLKPGGRLIIGVPNNHPYINGTEKFHALNLPPHHAGLWNKKALSALAELYNLNIVTCLYDPFANVDYATQYLIDNSSFKGLLKKLRPWIRRYFYYTRAFRKGQGITMIYSKQ